MTAPLTNPTGDRPATWRSRSRSRGLIDDQRHEQHDQGDGGQHEVLDPSVTHSRSSQSPYLLYALSGSRGRISLIFSRACSVLDCQSSAAENNSRSCGYENGAGVSRRCRITNSVVSYTKFVDSSRPCSRSTAALAVRARRTANSLAHETTCGDRARAIPRCGTAVAFTRPGRVAFAAHTREERHAAQRDDPARSIRSVATKTDRIFSSTRCSWR